jgi:hypothetical protein
VNKVQQTLTALERAGAIIRVSVMTKNEKGEDEARRHIFASTKILEGYPPASGVWIPPAERQTIPPDRGGIES